jgi:hypothetical protein
VISITEMRELVHETEESGGVSAAAVAAPPLRSGV